MAIPFQYSPYVSDNSFGLGLSWDDGLPGSDDGEANRRRCGFKNKTGHSSDKVLSISIFIFAMVVITVTVIKIYYSKKIRFQDEEKNPFEVEKLLEA